MGRMSYSDTLTVEECKKLSISFLNKNSYFKYKNVSGEIYWGSKFNNTGSISIVVSTQDNNPYASFSYMKNDARIEYRVWLTTTPCYFGGIRWWFICPLEVNGIPCNKRVGTLYLPPHSEYFGCRHCHELTYTSVKENHKYDSLLSFFS